MNRNWGPPIIGINSPFTKPSEVVDGVTGASGGVNHSAWGEESSDLNDKSQFNDSNLLDYLNNIFTGNLDYNRTLELLKMEQDFNKSEAREARDWQAHMSNTAYSRAAADLKRAGYNPALMLSGNSAYVGSAPQASSTSKNYSNSGTNATNLVRDIISSYINAAAKVGSSMIDASAKLGSSILDLF